MSKPHSHEQYYSHQPHVIHSENCPYNRNARKGLENATVRYSILSTRVVGLHASVAAAVVLRSRSWKTALMISTISVLCFLGVVR